jgi:feruloyl esterase
MRALFASSFMLVPVIALAQSSARTPADCERLASVSLPNTQITLAQVVEAGRFTLPSSFAPRGGGGSSALAGTIGGVPDVPGRVTANTAGLGLGYNGGKGIPPFSALPAFCRVAATLKPTPVSDIRMELWLPITGWNGNFRGTSPNGLGGVINYNAMGVGLTDGFAIASMDTGHQGGDTKWMQVPERVTDFAGRAMHETTVAGKALTNAYYGSAPRFSYMIECGGGSAAALHEVQKYPADYHGVVVGGHAAHLTRQIFGQVWLWEATHPDGVAVFPQTPKEIECRGADGADCLTAAQVEAARKVYAGPSNPRTGERVWSGLYRGSELDWQFFTEAAGPMGIATSTLRDVVLKDPTWDYKASRIDYDKHVTAADQSDIARVSASNADIAPFIKQGGKLILSGGWNNALVPAGAVLDYYERVRKAVGPQAAQQAVRLYMVPGMIECNGGPGTDTFDLLGVMRTWVERGQAPQAVPASRVEYGKVVRTRPLCPYPQVAAYRGSGSTDDARNFVCK